MPLAHRHRAGIKPYIDQFRYPTHPAAALAAYKGDLIHVRSMQISFSQALTGTLRKFSDGADAILVVAAFTLPHRQRGSPITLASKRPIHIIFEPVAKTSFTNMLRIPVDLVVQFNHTILELAGANVPGGACIVQQRSTAAPAEGISMHKSTLPEE